MSNILTVWTVILKEQVQCACQALDIELLLQMLLNVQYAQQQYT